MRDFIRLREHLRLALASASFAATLGLGCSASTRPPPGGGGPLVSNRPDGGAMQGPELADVPLPDMSAYCNNGEWCGPTTQATRLATQGTPSALGCVENFYPPGGGGFSLNVDATTAKRSAGDQTTCCYYWNSDCVQKGRPLREGAHLLVAPVRVGPGWAAGSSPSRVSRMPPALPSALRETLAAAWLTDALAEHASIASFARATVELMALGAPPALVAGCQRAALDEIRHAERCFALASRFAGQPLAPGPLPAPAPRPADLVRLAQDTFAEGCVAETTATLVATRALGACRDPETRAVLAMIVRDETRHAILAWRTVAWAVARGGAPVVTALAAAVAQTAAAWGDARGKDGADHRLARYGRLTAAAEHAAAATAWREIIQPTLAGIAATAGRPSEEIIHA